MNYDQITSQVRTLTPIVLGYLLSTFHLTDSPWLDVGVLVVVTAGCCVWGILNNRSGKVIQPTVTGNPPSPPSQ